MSKKNTAKAELEDLVLLIKKLRAPDGCPWDRQQKREDIGKYILEEAYEVIDALAERNRQAIKEELGDLLFQILFLSEMEAEANEFSLSDIISGIRNKMVRRHPHIFGDVKANTAEEVKENWQHIKKKENDAKNIKQDLFNNIPRALPALKRAQKITSIASFYGFDWPKTADVLKKLKEELDEFNTALTNGNQKKIEEELGDLLFTLVNLSRFIKVDAETALMKTTHKFLQRFSFITDQLVAEGKTPKEATLTEMDALWNKAKQEVIKK
jgi:tetrapyrrole methylase family protein / MazG family protein